MTPQQIRKKLERDGRTQAWLARKLQIGRSALNNYLVEIRAMPENIRKRAAKILKK